MRQIPTLLLAVLTALSSACGGAPPVVTGLPDDWTPADARVALEGVRAGGEAAYGAASLACMTFPPKADDQAGTILCEQLEPAHVMFGFALNTATTALAGYEAGKVPRELVEQAFADAEAFATQWERVSTLRRP